MFFLPVSLLLLLIIVLLIPVLLILLPLRIVEAALSRLGIPGPVAFLLFLASLLGSLINIPIATRSAPAGPLLFQHHFNLFQPFFWHPGPATEMTLAINVGGAVIPLLIVFFLSFRAPGFPTIVASAISTLVCYLVAKPVPGIGITISPFVPSLVSVGCAFLLSPRKRAPVAYISGVLGVLIGADLLHLFRLPVYSGMMSIGGAGVFDGIFLVGILAALFA